MKPLILALALAGCATSDYRWEAHTTQPNIKVEWYKTDPVSLLHYCGYGVESAGKFSSCAIIVSNTCYIYSTLTEYAGRSTIVADGETLFWHEWQHCLGRIHHPMFLGGR